MSPILIRPVREQLEHDRLIRFLLLNKYKRRFEAIANIGDEHHASIKLGANALFPDIVQIDGKKLAGLVEVETGESVNNLEALAQWVHFAKARVPFHLYVPMPQYDAARRLCEHHHVRPAEIWMYRAAMDGFDLVRGQQNPVTTQGARTAIVERIVAKPKPIELPVEKPLPVPPPTKKPVVAAPAAKTLKPVKGSTPAPIPAPVKPVPGKPAAPVPPARPAITAKPAKPVIPVKAAKPAIPAKPVKLAKPAKPAKPAKVVKPAKPAKAIQKSTKNSKKKR